MVAKVSDLRAPPEVGRFYMVPIVRYRLRGVEIDWPVLGPRHEDGADLNFPHLHYHLDGRFMSDALLSAIRGCSRSDEMALAAVVLTEPTDIERCSWTLRQYGRLPARPTLKRRKCRRTHWQYPDQARERIRAHLGEHRIQARFGNPAQAIVRSDGSVLCPHRKVNLTAFPPDSDGLVTCPLHGLRVKCPPRTPATPKETDHG